MAPPDGHARFVVQRGGGGSPRRMRLAGLALLALLGFLLIPFFRDDETTTADTGATVADIAREPGRFAGKVVTVSGEVKRVLDIRAIVLGGPEFIDADELLIVGATSLPVVSGRAPDMPVAVNDILQATGSVRQFDLAAIEKEAGMDLDDVIFRAWTAKPVLVARIFHITPRGRPPAQGLAPPESKPAAKRPPAERSRSIWHAFP